MEVCCGRIILGFCRKGISQLTGRIAFASEKLCHGKSAFHTTLPCKKSRRNLVVIFYPGKVDDTADIQNHNDAVKAVFYHGKHGFFTGSKIEIPIWENLFGNLWHGGFIVPRVKFVVAFDAGTIPAFS